MSIYSDHRAHYEKASRHAALYDKRRETGKAGGHCLALLGGAAVFVALYVLVHVLSVASSWIASLWPF
ncbi:hypothetical protein SAMN04488020_109116 [Palleronia marisminoris]|nr:hypothetical protein SAMN04488020_109116 [Palleronia marisminoris]